jgi:ATP-dependent Zn protease
MSNLGIVSPEDLPKDKLHAALSDIIKDIEIYVKDILVIVDPVLHKSVEILLERETISGEEFRSMVKTAIGNQKLSA